MLYYYVPRCLQYRFHALFETRKKCIEFFMLKQFLCFFGWFKNCSEKKLVWLNRFHKAMVWFKTIERKKSMCIISNPSGIDKNPMYYHRNDVKTTKEWFKTIFQLIDGWFGWKKNFIKPRFNRLGYIKIPWKINE